MADTADRVVRYLVENTRCAECDAGYHLEDVHILDQVRGRIWDLAAVCHECLTLNIVRAIVRTPPDVRHAHFSPTVDRPALEDAGSDRRARASRIVHEMTAAERRHFRALPPIGPDDVLDVAAFLQEFDGDFRGLFSSEPGDP